MEPRDKLGDLGGDPRPFRGAPAPLFERLVTDGGHGHEPLRSYGISETLESIRRELSRILNTRRPFFRDFTFENRLSAIDYGIPDFSHLSPASATDRQTLESNLVRAIESFEPRLIDVRVQLEEHPTNRRVVIGYLYANVFIRMASEPVCFPLELSTNGGHSEVESPVEPGLP
jgi:type VI secretion system lysozyme-like protein